MVALAETVVSEDRRIRFGLEEDGASFQRRRRRSEQASVLRARKSTERKRGFIDVDAAFFFFPRVVWFAFHREDVIDRECVEKCG